MPGIVVFRRRWSVGSDDLVVPGAFLFVVHLIWLVVLATLVFVIEWHLDEHCVLLLWEYTFLYLGVLALSLLLELTICLVAMRGSILDTGPRASMQYLLYVRFAVMVIELGLLIVGVLWVVYHYRECPIERAKETILGLIICNWCILVSVMMTVWCTYDAAGRSWVKMKQYQRSMRESESRFQYKRSGSTNRNWRQRKVIRAYQDSWDQRCRLLFCCMRPSDRNRNSFADIAKLLSDFFRDLDVVPSDVVAGLVLLRKFQKIEREAIIKERKNDTYEFLSGVAVTPRTQFLRLNDPRDLQLFQSVIHYMHYALGAYGWPVFLMTYSTTGVCQLCTKIRCTCLPCLGSSKGSATVVEDNCCQCNYAALQRMVETGDVEVTYATFHVDVGETPFFVAVDYARRKIIISIRGTLSMKDVITDLNAEGEVLPVTPPRDDWLGHKGMVQAAEYIRHKLIDEEILLQARHRDAARGTMEFGLVLVGHSLGAGTASILAILLRQDYPDLICYSFSPPGGLLSMPAVQYSKEFTISVVVGKDVVPRIGLHQMESLRADLINAIQRSVDPKWKTIMCSVVCCGCAPMPTSAATLRTGGDRIDAYQLAKDAARSNAVHPSDSSIALTLHHPLYPPGRIIHIVRHHPSNSEQAFSKKEPVYQAVWAENTDFDEVLISPVMIQDHMPDKVLEALNKVVTTFGPRKPQRQTSNSITSADTMDPEQRHLLLATPPPVPQRLCVETSFTSLQSPSVEIYQNFSVNSSVTGSYYPAKISPIQLSAILYPDMPSRSPSWYNQSQGCSSLVTSPQSWQPCLGTPAHPAEYPKRKLSAPNNCCHRTVTLPLRPDNAAGAYVKTSYSMSNVEANRDGHRLRTKGFSLDIGDQIDLIHDDWFGLAPLASPESLSEISSISSRASFGFMLGDATNLTEVLSSSYELRTPKVMRRTPKIARNLSTCADDIRNVRYFQKLGRTSMVLRCPSLNGSSKTDTSSDLSYESATSASATKCCGKLTDVRIECSKTSYLQNRNIDLGFINTSTETDSYVSAENILEDNTQVHVEGKCISGCPNCPCKYRGSHSDLVSYDSSPYGRKIVFKEAPKTSCCANYDHSDCLFSPDDPNFPSTTLRNSYVKTTTSDKTVTIPKPGTAPAYLETHFDRSFFQDENPPKATDAFCLPLKLHSNTLRSPENATLHVPVGVPTQQQFQRNISSPDAILSRYSDNPSTTSSYTLSSHMAIHPSQMLSPTSPQLDQDIISNFAIDLNLDPENRSIMPFGSLKPPEVVRNSPSVDSGSICKTPSELKTVSFSPQVINLDTSTMPLDARHSADLKSIMKDSVIDAKYNEYQTKNPTCFRHDSIEKLPQGNPKHQSEETYTTEKKESKKTDRWFLLPKRSPSKLEKTATKTVTKRQTTLDTQCFSKNESLPLLSGLNSTAEKTSPSYVRRKKYIYPITKVGRGESSV